MKKIVTILLFILLFSLLLTSCVDKDTPADTKFEIIDYIVPSDLPAHTFKLEWIGDDGEIISFNPNKPVMILFNGKSVANSKENFMLDKDIYFFSSATDTEGVLASAAKDLNLNLAWYWRKMGFNVGVFHYENFADDTPANLYSKFYNKDKMTYINDSGITVTRNLPDYTITEAFVMEWLKLMEKQPIKGTVYPNQCMEVRFVGNAGGEGLAISAAEYLFNLYENGHIDGKVLPNRISMLNAYLDNKDINLPISYRDNESLVSILNYSAKLVPMLAKKGVVFEMIESDSHHFLSYDTAYSGLVASEKDGEYALGDNGDALLYKTIQNATAYLAFSESYSSRYPESYKVLDRAVRDWYLYSINGSDETNLSSASNKGYADTLPMLDDRYGYSNSFVHYSLSAWTPTSYTRALKGAKFAMFSQTYSSDGTYVKTPYKMDKMRAESEQISDLSTAMLCGYVYFSRDKSSYINYGIDSRMENVEIRITINLDATGNRTELFKVYTDKDGFYMFIIDKKYYDKSMSISAVLPSREYLFSPTANDTTEYAKLSQNTISSSDNVASVNISENKSQIIVRNCELRKASD